MVDDLGLRDGMRVSISSFLLVTELYDIRCSSTEHSPSEL
jgi:hypothetical protein